MSTTPVGHFDFLVYGASGFFGTNFVHALEAAKKSYVVGKARLEDRAAIAAELDLYTPKYVVSAAGLAGNPNIVRIFSSYDQYGHKALFTCGIYFQVVLRRSNSSCRIGSRLINKKEFVEMFWRV